MRYLILSDIHANREALEAVLAAARGRYDQILCCGDLVGYGADPVHVLDWTRSAVQAVIRGNHDKACAGLDDLEWFNPSARASALWTRGVLSETDIQYLSTLPQGPSRVEEFSLIHGSPVDEDEYLIQPQEAADVAPYLDSSLTFFGHTHVQGGFLLTRSGVRFLSPLSTQETTAALELEPHHYYLINPGSVGQPRDGDPRAAFAIYTTDQNLVEYFRVEYDIAAAQHKIRAAGLPRSLADRLARGA